jgi:type IV pilus biogenesis protein CpaD/CtpE
MSSIKETAMSVTRILLLSAMAASLAACVESQPALSSDFGVAVRQDVAAQIADPDAHYGKTTSDGARAALAQYRYRNDKVTPPSAAGASMSPTAGAAATPQNQ